MSTPLVASAARSEAMRGGWVCRQSPKARPPRIASDLAALAAKGVDICYVAEDVAERGIERNELINGAQPVARGGVGELLGRYDRVWYW